MTDSLKALKVYKDYCAIKAHYNNEKYDYFLNNGKTKAGAKSFEARKDKLFFHRLAKHSDYLNYIIANIAYDNSWIGDITLNKHAEENYNTFRKNKQSLSYVIKNDLKKLDPIFRKNFLVLKSDKGDYDHPLALKLYIDKEISLETLTVLSSVTNIYHMWNKTLINDPLWNLVKLPILKHSTFLNFEKSKIIDIILDTCSEW